MKGYICRKGEKENLLGSFAFAPTNSTGLLLGY